MINSYNNLNERNIMDKVIDNDTCKNQLQAILETQLRASRKDDNKSASDSKKLLPFIMNYLETDKSNQQKINLVKVLNLKHLKLE